ncbi:hypothetical protein CSKR_100058 [Clonorchis sinensis]|uniref:Uncharacterized protein n=1 Tax=Clonorchis sinensis TaxID=79923 RepID=A0A419QCD8_CLOSI|nr:hypothetical protein CSKR_100058 [Clonorchis sinensis]
MRGERVTTTPPTHVGRIRIFKSEQANVFTRFPKANGKGQFVAAMLANLIEAYSNIDKYTHLQTNLVLRETHLEPS